ncbi:MAG: RNA polymerase factor sigma-54 [Chitinophagaceae bacterium]|nr:RNA polymerase factor sigma-54 [Chitinophagaceae bacterium]
MLHQSQQQRMLQRMSPQQIQFLKLLRVPTLEMETRIKEEMEINPALEYSTDDATNDIYDDDAEDKYEEGAEDVALKDDQAEQIDIDDYLRSESDDGGYDNNYNKDADKSNYSAQRYEVSFHQYLLEQLHMLDLTERQILIAEQVIGSINDDGYLSRSVAAMVDDLAFSRNVITDEGEVKGIIQRIQSFDPAGIATYTLQECLLLQLHRIGKSNYAVQNAILILEKQYDAFIKKHYEKIKKSLKLDEDDFQHALDIILKLNPKPGAAFEGSSNTATYILPDFFLENNEGVLEIMLNSKNAPELRISQDFKNMLEIYDKGNKKDKKNAEAVTFIKQKLDAAQWFINSIKERQNTLIQTMSVIANLQKEYLITGDETTLKPMILKDVAELTNLDISTVSRVANSKYVQTQFGTFSLKHFFSEKITMENGEEVTNKEIKSIIADIVSNENKKKPLRDEDIMDTLAKKSYNISRRTVAKYREQMQIPVARLRKS